MANLEAPTAVTAHVATHAEGGLVDKNCLTTIRGVTATAERLSAELFQVLCSTTVEETFELVKNRPSRNRTARCS